MKPDDGQFSELCRAFSALLDGELSEVEVQALDKRVAHDPEVQDAYVRYMRICGEIRRFAGEASSADTGAPTEVLPAVVSSRWRRAWEAIYDVANNYITLSILISTITMAIIVLSMGLVTLDEKSVTPRSTTPSIEIVAEITNTQDARWDKSSDGNFKNIELFSDERLVLNSGMAEVTFRDGAVVLLEAPVTFVVRSTGSGSLDAGKLFARVPDQAIGFKISTPTAEIVDLGTEFGVAVAGNGDTVAEVTVGAIGVRRRLYDEPASAMTRVEAGSAALVTAVDVDVVLIPKTKQFVTRLPQASRPQQLPRLKSVPGLIVNGDFHVNRLGDGGSTDQGIGNGWFAKNAAGPSPDWAIRNETLVQLRNSQSATRVFQCISADDVTGTGWRLEFDLIGVGIGRVQVFGGTTDVPEGDTAAVDSGKSDRPPSDDVVIDGWTTLIDTGPTQKGNRLPTGHVVLPIAHDMSAFDLVVIRFRGDSGSVGATIDNVGFTNPRWSKAADNGN